MHITIKGGSDTTANARWMTEIRGVVEGTLSRFERQITGVDVFLSDENSREKDGNDDKRCLIEARLAGMQPLAVRTNADTFEQAISDCAEKLVRTIESRLGRLADKDGQVSQSGDVPLGPPDGALPDTGESDQAK